MNGQIIAAFGLYFIFILILGLTARRKQYTASEFIMGNRSLSFWLTSLSAHASDMSAWLFMAFPAAIFIGGLPQIWIAIGLVIGMFLNWQFVAPKLRIQTEEYDSLTLSTFFERRFSDTTGIVRTVTAAMALIFLTSYVSALLIGMGRVFEPVFGIDYYLALSVATIVAMAYTFAGGYITIAWTDLFQALFLIFVISIVPIIAFFHLSNGWSEVAMAAGQQEISLAFFPDYSVQSFLGVVFLILSWGLGYFGQPHVITKFMGIKDASQMYKAKYLGISWQIMALSAAAAIGFIGIAFFPQSLDKPELVFVNMVQALFTPFFAGIVLCGIIAANLSTMVSQILVCASVLSEDFYKHLVRRSASQLELLRVSRLGVVLISMIALFLAFSKNASVLELVLYAWSGLGCAFGPLVLASLYLPRTNRFGAIAGIFVGGSLAGLWPMLNPYLTNIEIPSMIPGFFFSILSIYVVSCLTTKQEAPSLSNGH